MPPGTLLLAEFERKMSGDSRFGAWTKWAVVPLTEAGKARASVSGEGREEVRSGEG